MPSEITVPEVGATFPMGDHGGRPVVEVSIDGRGPFRFLLDTGALLSVIDSDLQRELSLPTPPSARGSSQSRHAPGLWSIRELRIGGAVLRNVVGVALPLGRLLGGEDTPRGILSASIFRGHLVTFDYPGRRVTIRRGELPPADDVTRFDYTEDEPLPSVTLRVSDCSARVHVDTGSGYGLLLPSAYSALLPLASSTSEGGRLRTLRGEHSVSWATLAEPVRLGRYTLDVAQVGFCDLQPAGSPAVGNLGYEALRGFVVTLDSSSRRIELRR